MPHHRRRRRRRSCLLSMAGGVSVGALLLFAGRRTPLSSPAIGSWQLQPQERFFPPPELLLSQPPELLLSEPPARQESQADLSLARRLLPVRRQSPPPQLLEDDAVLLPDEEVLILAAEPPVGNAMCVFPGESSSPARALGRLPGPGRHAYVCVMPRLLPSSPAPAAHLLDSAQQLQAPPRLLPSSPAPAAHLLDRLLPSSPAPASAADRTLLSWSDNKLVFHSAPLGGGGDVLVFAKGSRQGINMSPGDVQCLYSGATMVDASFPAITSTQQVTRCPSPPQSLNYCHITLVLRGQETLPSIATYTPNYSGLSVTHDKKLICACTMVRNVAKFLSEWVRYHAGIGIDHFYLYDNGSEDDLADQVAQLTAAGFKVLTVAWPWTKTQEAGFSHCAAVYRSSCHWMAFIDVDEFVFSPKWHSFDNPSKSMLEEVVSVDPQVGQIYLPCYDFGPSGQTAHPSDGVCQGYICRIEKPERHKSLVRLDAVDDSLKNSIHHFQLKSGFDSKWTWLTRVNHYKYQAWPEFKKKFDRRVSTYVTDWKDRANLQSADRAPGLGVEAIEPDDWPGRYCERNDSVMKDTSIKWFGVSLGGRGTEDDACFIQELVRFLHEFCTLSKSLPLVQQLRLFRDLSAEGVFEIISDVLQSQDRKIVSAGTDIVILFLNQDPNLLRSYIVQQEGNSLLGLLVKGMVTDFGEQMHCQFLEILRILMDSFTMSGAHRDVIIEIFYEKHLDYLVDVIASSCPPRSITRRPTNSAAVGRNTEVHRIKPEILLNICELLCFCVVHHPYRIKCNFLMNNAIEKILTMTRRSEKFLVVAAVRFMRTIISRNDEHLVRHVVKFNLLKPIIDAFVENGDKYNMLQSGVLELLEHIRKENLKPLVIYVTESFPDQLMKFEHFGSIQAFKLKYQQYLESAETKLSAGVPDMRKKAEGRGLEKEEEDYFNEDSDEEDSVRRTKHAHNEHNEERKADVANGSEADDISSRPKSGGLVDYADDDDEDFNPPPKEPDRPAEDDELLKISRVKRKSVNTGDGKHADGEVRKRQKIETRITCSKISALTSLASKHKDSLASSSPNCEANGIMGEHATHSDEQQHSTDTAETSRQIGGDCIKAMGNLSSEKAVNTTKANDSEPYSVR